MAGHIQAKASNFIPHETNPLIGQQEAIAQVGRFIQQVSAGFFDREISPGIFLFAGSPGVGKVSMAKIIARVFNCPLYRYLASAPSSSPRLVPFCDPQEALKPPTLGKTPCCVILLHEIEKAQKNTNELFFQLFEEGPLADTSGNKIFAKHSIIIMTTNLCAHVIKQQQRDSVNIKVRAFSILYFSQGFVDRLHDIIVFYPLDTNSILKIAEKYLTSVASGIERSKQIKITWDDSVIPLLVHQQSSATMSAREVHRNVREGFYKTLADRFYDGQLEKGDCIHLFEEREGVVGITKPVVNLHDALDVEPHSYGCTPAKL